MKEKFFILLISVILLSVDYSIAQAPPVFDSQLCFGGTGTDIPKKIIHAHDGGYIIAGSTTSTNGDIISNQGANDFWVIKTDAKGALEWQKTFGGSGNDIATAVLELSNDDVVVSGYTFSNNGNVTGNHGASDDWLIRLSRNGNLIWKKSLGGSSYEYVYSMTLAPDHGFVLAGSSSSNNGNVSGNHGGKDFWIVKTDTSGNLQWQKSLGGSGTEECYSIKSTADGGYIAAGYSTSNDGQVSGNHGGYDYWIVKLDSGGNLQWQKCVGGSYNDVGTTTIQNAAGNYMIGGYSNSNDGDVINHYGTSDFWVAWLDSSDGNMLSQNSYGGSNSDIIFDFIPTADNGYLIAGGTTSNNGDVTGNHGGEDFWLVKTDFAGNMVWEKTYGGTSSDRPVSVVQNEDGGFTTIGYSYSNNDDVNGAHGGADIWFLKLSCLTPVSSFVFPADTVCVNSSVDFTNTSLHAALHQWKIDNVPLTNTANSSFQFNALGTHKITLYSYTCYEIDSTSKFITVVDYPVPFITSNLSYLCLGNSARLSTIPADSYLWNNGAASREIMVDSGGDYSVTVTADGCSSRTFYSLNQYPIPDIDLGRDTSICSGSEITLSIAPGFVSYLWQDGSAGSDYAVDTDGEYFITVSNAYCSTTDSIHVSTISNPVPVITAGSSYLCGDRPESLFTIAADSYLWSTGETTPDIFIDSPGVYSVTVTTNGCSGSTTFTMEQHPIPSINIGNDTSFCSGSSLTLNAPTGYQSYSWQDGSSNLSLTVDSTGWYFVTVNDGFCNNTDSIRIVTFTCIYPVANFAASQLSVCQHACINFNDFSQDAVSWDWEFPGASTTNSMAQSPTGICYDSPGTYSIFLVVNSVSGFSNTMIRQDYITVNASPSSPLISSNGTFLTSSFATTYQWFLNDNPISGANDQTYFALHPGNYSMMITDANGCSSLSESIYIGITGISNTNEQGEWTIFPNPSKGIFNIHFNSHEMSNAEIEVTDLTGKKIIHSVLTSSKRAQETINLEQFSNGIYFLKIINASGTSIQKLIVEK